MNILSVIPARGASKTIPRKNLVDLGGKPLIAHIIEHALNVSFQTEVVVSTEDSEIAEIAKRYGAQVPFVRPSELAGDLVLSLPVVQHAVSEMERIRGCSYDLIVHLQPTSPLCTSGEIDACIEKLIANPHVRSVLAITEAETHPFRMKRLIDEDRVINFIDQGFEDMRPRQVLPKVYRRAGSIRVSRRSVVMDENSLVGEPCLGVIVSPETAIDIDNCLDLELVRLIYARGAGR